MNNKSPSFPDLYRKEIGGELRCRKCDESENYKDLLIQACKLLKPIADIAYNPPGWHSGWASGTAKQNCVDANKFLNIIEVVELMKKDK